MWNCPYCGRSFKKTNQNHFCGSLITVDDYIEQQPEEHRSTLYRVRETICEAMPNNTEKLYWKMPSYSFGGKIIFFAARKQTLAYYPGSEVIAIFAEQLEGLGLKIHKGAILFPWDRPMPYELIGEIARYCATTDERNGS